MPHPTDVYAQFGITAILPGLVRAVELLQSEIDQMRVMLANAQAGQPIVKRRGRPPGGSKKHATNGSVPLETRAIRVVKATPPPPTKRATRSTSATYWDNLTPAERSAEMKRRQAVSAGRAKSKSKRAPKDNSNAVKAARTGWAKLSKKEKAARIAAMNAARLSKRKAAGVEATIQ